MNGPNYQHGRLLPFGFNLARVPWPACNLPSRAISPPLTIRPMCHICCVSRDLDAFLSELAGALPVDIMPGAEDPANVAMPQQPLSRWGTMQLSIIQAVPHPILHEYAPVCMHPCPDAPLTDVCYSPPPSDQPFVPATNPQALPNELVTFIRSCPCHTRTRPTQPNLICLTGACCQPPPNTMHLCAPPIPTPSLLRGLPSWAAAGSQWRMCSSTASTPAGELIFHSTGWHPAVRLERSTGCKT